MARKKIGLKVRPNSIEENEMILRELREQNKVHDRSQKDLQELFDNLNATSLSKDAKDDEKFASFSNTYETTGTYGPIPGCPSGSWWGIRVDCSRQGVHKPFNLDVHEGPFGAISVCTPQSTDSKDVDFGDFLSLTGREYSESNSENESLALNLRNCVPLRLVRSYSLSNEYSPKTGYRYDGLYDVVAHWIGESGNSQKHNKFALKRINQEPPPWLQSVAKPIDPRVDRVKYLPKRLSCTLRKRSPKLKRQLVSSVESDKCEKLNRKLSESPSVSQNGIAILTRQVFKKPQASSETTPPVSQSAGTDTPVQNSYMYKKLGQSKLQNTNISVRTDLYDSSHNVHQEAKKSAPMTFCRIYKPNNLAKPEVTQAETLSIEKASSTDRPADWSEANNAELHRKNVEDEKITNAATDSAKETEVQRPALISRESIYRIVGCPISNETDKVDFARRDAESLDHQKTDRPEKRKSTASSTSSDSSNSLEALTPDKILNLVVKEKLNPMAKLLIGNVIGLSIEESTVMKAYNALISKDNKERENVERQSDNRLKTASNFKMISKRILRHNRNDESRKNYSKLAKRNRGCNDAGQKTGANSKFNDDPGGVIGYSKPVKRTKVPEDSKMKKSPGCKKQRREIANLVIDAKVGPIIRGPRNRRLRCQSHKRIGKEHDGFIASSAFPRRRGILNKQAKRSELSKRRKRLNGGITKARKLQLGNLNLTRGKQSKKHEGTRNLSEMLTRNLHVQRTTVESSGDQLTKKSKMVDAIAQCSLLSDLSMDSGLQMNPDLEHSSNPLYNSGRLSVVKIEEIDLDEIKSEIGAEFSEEESVGSHESLNGFESEEVISSSKTYERVAANRGLEPVYNIYPLIHRESAFVPVNSSSSLKIARLRSIGFRPIQIEGDSDFADNLDRISEGNSDSIRKEADEDYNKYANEETSDVGYMDDDLHYEDIENEDRNDRRKEVFLKRIATPICEKYKNPQSQGAEESLERPWHGWKKVTSEKGDQWIGW